MERNDIFCSVLAKEILISGTMPEVLTPAHSKINTMHVSFRQNFYLVIEISHTELHSCTKRWNVCAAV
jgi:hypothetical protein